MGIYARDTKFMFYVLVWLNVEKCIIQTLNQTLKHRSICTVFFVIG